METVFRLKVSEVNTDFIKVVRSLFKKDRKIEIIVHAAADSGLNKVETREEYWARIDKAIEDVEKNRNLVSFTGEEFETLVKRLEKT